MFFKLELEKEPACKFSLLSFSSSKYCCCCCFEVDRSLIPGGSAKEKHARDLGTIKDN